MKKRMSILVLLMVAFVSSSLAQITTSGLSGKVTADNEECIGATVEAVHTPSGTRYTTVTNDKGAFTINGMRVGGPYQVTITYIGFETKVVDGITLQLAETYNLNTSLSEDAQQLGEVVVSAKGTKFTTEKTGATTNISNEMMRDLPTVTRSITDVTRLSPYGGNGMSFAGSDGRTANFTVDGASFNNNFGLSDDLPGGGNPISIDAIEEMQVVISPYDVRQTNFIGGGLNAVTKSGTNTFKGSAYIYHRNENMRGDAVDREQISGARERDTQTTYGFTLGGPIIKDKLFFFANGEAVHTPTVVNRWRGSEDGVADADNYISRTTLADLETVSQYVKNKYGYDTGSYTSFPANEDNYKLLARIDWNINQMHHLAARYNYTKNTAWNSPNSSSMDGGSRMSGGRMSQYSMSYANSMYAINNTVHSFSIDLNSRFTDNLSNQLLVTYTKADDLRDTNSDEFPFIDILKDGQAYISLGYELFSYNNAVHTKTWNIKDDVTYYLGNHKIMGGITFEHVMADNQYMRNGTGYYRYTSLEDFLSGGTPEIVNLTYGYNGETDPAARVRYNKYGIYVQDEWNVNPTFKLTYGLRLDDIVYNNDDVMTNQAIYDLDYNGRHIDTGKWPSSNIAVSPRVGFTWDILGDKSLKLRGGTGLFQGRLPLVFLTNMPTNSGMVQYNANINASAAASKGFDMSVFSGGLVTDSNGKATIDALYQKLISLGYPSTITAEEGTVPSSISAVVDDFKMPQVWKTSLALDYVIPVSFPFTVTAEGIYNKTINGVYLTDWAVPEVDGFARFNGADNRVIYPEGFLTNTHAYVLENTSKGYGWSFSLSANARPTDWLSLMASYTHTVSKELTGMPGSSASSVLNYIATVDGPSHMKKVHNSEYVTPDRFVASASIHDHCGNSYSLIYETYRGGYNYSAMTTNDMNGDGYNYDAIYIPTDQEVESGAFRFVSDDDKTRFMDFVHNNKYFKNHQGEYAEAYSIYNPWVHRIDFSYKHDFKVNIGATKHTLQLSFDMKNVLNFFNSSWGVAKIINQDIASDGFRVLKYEGVDADGYATFSTPSSISGDTKMWQKNHAIGQCWYASVGIKYIFN